MLLASLLKLKAKAKEVLTDLNLHEIGFKSQTPKYLFLDLSLNLLIAVTVFIFQVCHT